MLNLPTILKGVKSWADLEKRLAPTDNQTKGAVFEYLTKKYLQFEPRYAAKIKHVWLPKEVPTAVAEKLKLPKTDQGIDLICEAHDGEFWSVQCKFVTDTDKKISHRQISTFMSLSFGLSKKISFGLICTTVDDYAAIYRGKSNIGFVLADEWQKLGEDFFHFARGDRKIQTPPKLAPRPHQTQAIRAAEKYFIKGKESRGKLVFPCGAGKSLAGYWIARKFAAKSIVVAVPSLALVKQTLETWLVQASADKFSLRWLCVCSDETIGKNGLRADDIHVGARPSTSLSNDDVAIHTQDLGVPCVTDPALIAGWLKHNKNQAKVIFTTYQSARALGEAVRKLTNHSPSPLAGRGFDLGILDEAHKTVGTNDKLFSYLLYDKNVKIRRRIFMTATERRYSGSSDNIVSMDDADLFGDTFEHMSFAHAVDAGILSDYKIVTLAISNQDIADAVKDNSLSKDGVEARSYAALVALRKAMQKYPIHHAVSFHGSIAKAEDFKKQQDLFTQQHPEFSPLETFHVSGKMPTARRSKIIQEFTQSPSSLITNAKCLTEGVDVPKIDAVLFADPRRSTVDIVQAVGRALRKSPGKKSGYVILPLFTGRWPATAGDATGDAILESADFKEIIQTLRALASNDERIVEYFRDVSKGKTPRGKLIEFDVDVKATANFSADDLVRELQLRTWNRLAKLNWRPFEEAREFVQSLGLKDRLAWMAFAKSGIRPADVPATPERTYKGQGWAGYGDWLGTGAISSHRRTYRDFEKARKFVHALNLKSRAEWERYCQSGTKPADIPFGPHKIYKDGGWQGIGDWLGTGSVANFERTYQPFKKARVFARSLKLQTVSQWQNYCKSGKRPVDIPANPDRGYAGKGWLSYGDWLGTGRVADHLRQYRDFESAREFAQSMKLKSSSEWQKFSKSGKRPEDIPATPDKTYKGKGWKDFGDWLGTGAIAPQKLVFRSFTDAKDYATEKKINSMALWKKLWRSGKMPDDLPGAPENVYRDKGWCGWGDFLGNGHIPAKFRDYLSFETAREFVRSLGLKNQHEWLKDSKSGKKPANIPSKPERLYATVGWRGLPDFLGTGRISGKYREYLPFTTARQFVQRLGLKNQHEWSVYCQSGAKPTNIPAKPERIYKVSGWVNLGDWLGTSAIANFNRVYRAFPLARKFAHTLNLKDINAWRSYCRSGKKPNDIPADPHHTYKNKGWVSVGDWLGTGSIAARFRVYKSFKVARQYVRSLNLKGNAEWRKYAKSNKKPQDIPTTPERIYAKRGWQGYGDWLGTGNLASSDKKFRSFEDAKLFFRKHQINGSEGWKEICRAGRRPADMPAALERVYKSEWRGWPDFLGTAKGKPAKKPRKKK